METTAVSYTQPETRTAAAASTLLLDKDAFLKLLIIELQNQDPLNPMNGRDSIAQLAQFSALEQTANMANSLQAYGESSKAAQAFSMVGKWVDYVRPDGATATGRVDSVSLEGGEATFRIGGDTVGLGQIATLYTGADAFGKAKAGAQALDLIGQRVQYMDRSTGRVAVGVVDGVSFVDGWPKLNIGSTVADMGDLISVYGSSSADDSDQLTAQAAAMVGKTIDYTYGEQVFSGKVVSYESSASGPKLRVDGKLIDLGDVVKVYAPQS
jgi:flagellar basal-body rod modification protein FlgD